MRGRKALPTLVKMATGNRGRQALPVGEPMPEGLPVKPDWLVGEEECRLWADLVRMGFWLKEPDSLKMAGWCVLQAEFPTQWRTWTAQRWQIWRTLGSELGLGPVGARPDGHGETWDESRRPREEILQRRLIRLRRGQSAVVARQGCCWPTRAGGVCDGTSRTWTTCGARGLIWDRAAMQHALGFFPEVLKLAGGQFEGAPFDLHPSQAFIVGSLFGWKRADGRRRFRRAYIEQGKGNGKSPLSGWHRDVLSDVRQGIAG